MVQIIAGAGGLKCAAYTAEISRRSTAVAQPTVMSEPSAQAMVDVDSAEQ